MKTQGDEEDAQEAGELSFEVMSVAIHRHFCSIRIGLMGVVLLKKSGQIGFGSLADYQTKSASLTVMRWLVRCCQDDLHHQHV